MSTKKKLEKERKVQKELHEKKLQKLRLLDEMEQELLEGNEHIFNGSECKFSV